MARGRIAAVGTLTQIRDLLDDQPLSVRIDTPQARQLAAQLLRMPEVVCIDLEPQLLKTTGEILVVQVRHPKRFFESFGQSVVDNDWEIARLEALDDSAHAILGYLLGGSGKT